MAKFLLRVVLFLVGLVLAAGLATAVLALAAIWMLRNGWARLTGRRPEPWVMRFDPGKGFDRFRKAAPPPAEPRAAEVVNARARGASTDASPALGAARDLRDDVTDVTPRPASRPE
ncbi:MAG: hypothetical protein EOO22_07510 [Comamonadaceae bacterium]|nr:MAG: hypothetical protein EOO22_07510 [Comamonadaceae bacterium]